MSRLISVALTEDSIRNGTKTETRRLGWWTDKRGRRLVRPGDTLTTCRKIMGRKPGEPLVRIRDIEVTDVRREPLFFIDEAGVQAEAVPMLRPDGSERFSEWWCGEDCIDYPTPDAWVAWFSEEMRCPPDQEITVITFRYPPSSQVTDDAE